MNAYILGLDDYQTEHVCCLDPAFLARFGLVVTDDYVREGRILSVNHEGELYDLTAELTRGIN